MPLIPPAYNPLTSKEYFKNYLKRDDSIPSERYKAFEVPSLVNGKRVPATKIRSDLVGGPKYLGNLDHARD